MSTTVTGYQSTIWEVTDAIIDLLNDQAGPLGLKYVGAYDEKRIPYYPAVVVSPGGREKNVAGVQKFDIGFSVDLWVYHAALTESHATRSRLDLQLVDDIEEAVETGYPIPPAQKDYTLGGRVVFGYIADQVPGVIQARTDKTELIVGTRMQWIAISRKGFGIYGP